MAAARRVRAFNNMNTTTALFYVFSAVLLGASFRVITARSTVHAALFLRPGGRLAGVRDRHALSSTWSIPFAFLLAFTGPGAFALDDRAAKWRRSERCPLRRAHSPAWTSRL